MSKFFSANLKKFILILTLPLIFLFGVAPAFAQEPSPESSGINIQIAEPEAGISPNADPGKVLSNVITIVFVVAALVVLFMLIFGAFEWITSGGEKEAVGKARGRIMNALIGIAILALAFLLVRLVGQVINIDLTNLTLPTLDQGAVPDATPEP